LAAVLVFGVALGYLVRLKQRAADWDALVAELARDRVVVNSHEPTLLCLVLMKVFSTSSVNTASRCSKWLGRGWFLRPVGFNAGRLQEDQVPHIVERLQRLGTVHEVHFWRGSLKGLRLFYIQKIGSIGPERQNCTFKEHPTPDVASGL